MSDLELIEQERDDLAERLSELLCDLTGGLLSRPTYPVAVMVSAIEDYFERTVAAVAWDEGHRAGVINVTDGEAPFMDNPYRSADA